MKQSCSSCPEENAVQKQALACSSEWMRFPLAGLFPSIRSAEHYLLHRVFEIFSCYESELKEAPMHFLFVRRKKGWFKENQRNRVQEAANVEHFNPLTMQPFNQRLFFFSVSCHCERFLLINCWWKCFVAKFGGNVADVNFLRANLGFK